MPPKRPPGLAPLQVVRTASSNIRNEINLESQRVLGRIRRVEDMAEVQADIEKRIPEAAKITCAVIRPLNREITCIAVKNITDHLKKRTPINTIFYYNRDVEMWVPLSSIFNRRPSNPAGHFEMAVLDIVSAAERERRSLADFQAHPQIRSLLKYGVFGSMNNALCSQLLKLHSDAIIEHAEDEGEIVVLTEEHLDNLDVSELALTPTGFFAEYDGHCVTFQIPTEPHRRRHVPIKTRPAESHQRNIDDILTARFEGLSLARETHTPKSKQLLSKSRKAHPVIQRKSNSGKYSKKAAKKQNGAAKPNNNDAESSSGSRK